MTMRRALWGSRTVLQPTPAPQPPERRKTCAAPAASPPHPSCAREFRGCRCWRREQRWRRRLTDRRTFARSVVRSVVRPVLSYVSMPRHSCLAPSASLSHGICWLCATCSRARPCVHRARPCERSLAVRPPPPAPPPLSSRCGLWVRQSRPGARWSSLWARRLN